jgi:putative aldouronate transport system substrate-binding protein
MLITIMGGSNMRSKYRPILYAMVFILFVFPAGCKKSNDQKSDTEKVSSSSSSTTSFAESTSEQKSIPEYLNVTGFPIVNEPITLTAMVAKSPVQPDFEEILVWQEYEKMTGVKIDWESIPAADIAEKRNLAIASGDMPDLFYRANIPGADILKYGEQGAFIRLNELIDKYALNYKNLASTMLDLQKSIPAYDGSIYALPSVLDIEAAEIQRKLFINKTWLDRVNMKMPTSTYELYDVLKAFKEQDPNNNGEQDEIPLSAPGLVYLMDCLKGSWGLGNRGITHNYVDINEETGELRFFPIETTFRDLLEYMNRLYNEKLLDQEIFTMNSTLMTAKLEEKIIGAFSYTNTMGTKYAVDFEGLGEALEGPNGDKLWAGRRSRIAAKGAFVITSVNKYPDVAMRWVDYFYGDEGARMFYMGIEGVSYEKTPDGKYKYLDEIVNNIPEGSSFGQVIAKYVPYGGGGGPTVTKPDYFSGGEMEPVPLKAAQNMSEYTPKEVWGPFSYSIEENERIVTLENDIISYVNQSVPQFIQGQLPLSQWNSYVEQIKKMGLE